MNPYGITQVDVPGVLGAAQAYQTNRIQQMMMQRQVEAADRQADRELEQDATIARLTGRGGKQGGVTNAYSPGDVVGQSMYQGSGGMIGTPAPQQAPQQQPGVPPELTPDQLLELRLSGPRGVQVAEAFEGRTAAQRAASERRAVAGYRVARSLLDLPPDQVMSQFQAAVPELLQNGFTQEELSAVAQGGLTREEIIQLMRRGLAYMPASYRNVDGEVIDERLLGTGIEPRVYASEYITTPTGLEPRPGGRGFGQQAPAETIIENDQGVRMRLDRQRNEWVPVDAPQAGPVPASSTPDLDNWNNAGRAGPGGPRTFR